MNAFQKSFAAGEVCSAIYGRVDLTKYQTGCKTLRNFFVARHGGAFNRGGAALVVNTKYSDVAARFIPFVIDRNFSYVLEFGHLYMRVIRNGSLVYSGGVPYEIVTPYTMDEVRQLKFSVTALQSFFALGHMLIVHRSHLPQTLAFFGDTLWTLNPASYDPLISPPASLSASASAGSIATQYIVTSVRRNPYEESYSSNLLTVTGAAPTTGTPITVSWTAVADAIEYNIYKAKFGVYGYIGSTQGLSFTDDGYTGAAIDVNTNPPQQRIPFFEGLDSLSNPVKRIPSCVGFYQQRVIYGDIRPASPLGCVSPVAAPYYDNFDGLEASKIGRVNNFAISRPTLDDDPIIWRLLGRSRNEVRHILDIAKLAVFTSSGEWIMEGDQNGSLTPTIINPRQYSDYGCAPDIAPIPMNGGAIFIQEVGSILRTFGFDIQVDGYRGNDLTIFSSHLIDGYEMVAWAYQKTPHSIVWTVREDGVLLGLTIIPEQQLYGWHRHDMDGGLVEDICCIPEGKEDAVYLLVRRTIDGDTIRTVERLTSRTSKDILDAVIVDGAVTWDGRNTDSSFTMMLSGGTTWEYDETITCTASQSYFNSNDPGTAIHFRDAENKLVRFQITSYISPTVVMGRPDKMVPADLQTQAVSTWTRALRTIDGLDHLEGEAVSIIGDGFVIANPNNPDYDLIYVNGGQVDLGEINYGVVHVGKAIVADLETLNIDELQGGTLMDKRKLINKLTVLHETSRGFWAGGSPPDDNSQDPTVGLTTNLDETKIRYDEGYDDPVALRTGTTEIDIQSQWNSHGRVFIRQIDPLPLSILSISPAGFIPFAGTGG